MQASANEQADLFDRVSNRTSTFDRPCRAVEGCKGTIAGELDDRSSCGGNVLLNYPVVSEDRCRPCIVPNVRRRSVDPTMSVKSTVDKTRLDAVKRRSPVRKDSVSSSTGPVSPANQT
jgi:hypothetical protein